MSIYIFFHLSPRVSPFTCDNDNECKFFRWFFPLTFSTVLLKIDMSPSEYGSLSSSLSIFPYQIFVLRFNDCQSFPVILISFILFTWAADTAWGNCSHSCVLKCSLEILQFSACYDFARGPRDRRIFGSVKTLNKKDSYHLSWYQYLDIYFYTKSDFEAAKTAPWPSLGLHHCVNSVSPQMSELVEDAIASWCGDIVGHFWLDRNGVEKLVDKTEFT